MAAISRIGTSLPTWGTERARQIGDDEDTITLAVGARPAALTDADRSEVRDVVLVSRGLPLLEGDSGAPLLAGRGRSRRQQYRGGS